MVTSSKFFLLILIIWITRKRVRTQKQSREIKEKIEKQEDEQIYRSISRQHKSLIFFFR